MRQLNSTREFNTVFKVILALMVLLMVMLAASVVGAASISCREVINAVLGKEVSKSTYTILFKVRFPRILTSAVVGGLLSVVGALMQGIFKNKMADPSVMGISGGAGLGASLIIALDIKNVYVGISAVGLGALIGAAITHLIILSVVTATARKGLDSISSTLLAGIAISSFTSSMITVIMALHRDNMEKVYMWMLGSFSASSQEKTIFLIILSLILVPLIMFIAPGIDILKLGSTTARTYGVNPKTLMRQVLTLSSIAVAFTVASSGIIGFVGLVIPHIVTFFGIRRMRPKILMSFIVGAIFVLLSDTIARTILAPSELPVGAITSLIGAPYFLILLLKGREERS